MKEREIEQKLAILEVECAKIKPPMFYTMLVRDEVRTPVRGLDNAVAKEYRVGIRILGDIHIQALCKEDGVLEVSEMNDPRILYIISLVNISNLQLATLANVIINMSVKIHGKPVEMEFA